MIDKLTYSALLKTASEELSKAGVEDAVFDARCLVSKASGKAFSELMFSLSDSVPCEVQKKLSAFVERRKDREPLQYIIGEWDFFGLEFYVGEGVLIPRPETEFLVNKAIEETPQNGVVYDVCSGSGCIGVSVANARKDVTVYLFEKYELPFSYLLKNIDRHKAENVRAIKCDMKDGLPRGIERPDVILSNPPYIKASEIPLLQTEVQKEPKEALDGGEDGYDFYRALADKWYPELKKDGIICMECGENMPYKTAELFENKGGITRVFSDMFGIERFVSVTKYD